MKTTSLELSRYSNVQIPKEFLSRLVVDVIMYIPSYSSPQKPQVDLRPILSEVVISFDVIGQY